MTRLPKLGVTRASPESGGARGKRRPNRTLLPELGVSEHPPELGGARESGARVGRVSLRRGQRASPELSKAGAKALTTIEPSSKAATGRRQQQEPPATQATGECNREANAACLAFSGGARRLLAASLVEVSPLCQSNRQPFQTLGLQFLALLVNAAGPLGHTRAMLARIPPPSLPPPFPVHAAA